VARDRSERRVQRAAGHRRHTHCRAADAGTPTAMLLLLMLLLLLLLVVVLV